MRPRDVVLVRAGSGHLHIGRPTRRGYQLACFNDDLSGPTVKALTGQAAEDLWKRRPNSRCEDCQTLRKRGWFAIRRVTGW